jgi:HlyD family secretion protein
MSEKWSDAPSPLSFEISLRQAVFNEERAVTRKRVLEQFTKAKTIQELESEVAKARANELSRKLTYDQMKSAGGGLISEIMNQK